MISDITTHTSPQGDPIRTITENGNPLFNGSDVCKALGYGNTSEALKKHCKGGIMKRDTPTASGVQLMSYISEPDLYRLIMRSRLPEAERFEAWVVEEVLPSIRKNGGYLATSPEDTPELIMARALKVADVTMKKYQEQARLLTEQNQLLTDKVETDAPKVRFAEAVADSDTLILVRDLAKLITQNGVEMGERKLYQWLRDNKLIEKNSTMPQQWAVERGFFRVVEQTIIKPNGDSLITRTTKVTGKGQQYIIDRILKEHSMLPAA